jgi:hypothetical protein
MVKSTVLDAPLPLGHGPERIGSSAIRDLLAVAQRPEVRSLAGGLPDPATFPVAAIAAATSARSSPRTPPAPSSTGRPTGSTCCARPWPTAPAPTPSTCS